MHRVEQSQEDLISATSVVGLPGREIAFPAIDEQMKRQIAQLELAPDTDHMESVYKQGDQTIHRTLWPFFATEPSCANCHNQLQNLTGGDQWRVGDLMGAQHVDQDISSSLMKASQYVLIVAALVFLTFLALSYCGLIMYKQYQLRKELSMLATTDSMTGCINRREMYARIYGLKTPVSGALLLLDLDRFKQINDTHGHAAGDAVIQDFAARIKTAVRANDWAARIGGEEFVVWLPDASPSTALLVAERLRKEIEASSLEHEDATINYTVSIGIHIVNNDSPSLLDSWIKMADEHLYRAKSNGRNCIEFEKKLMVASSV